MLAQRIQRAYLGRALEQSREEAGDVGNGERDAGEIALARHARNGAWVARGVKGCGPRFVVGDNGERLAIAVPVDLHTDDLWQGSGEPVCSLELTRRHDERAVSTCLAHGILKERSAQWVGGTKAQIDQPRSAVGGPHNRAGQRLGTRDEGARENFHGEQLRVRRLFGNGGGDRSTVTEPIREVVAFFWTREIHTTTHARHVRVRCVYAAIYDGNRDAAARSINEWCSVECEVSDGHAVG